MRYILTRTGTRPYLWSWLSGVSLIFAVLVLVGGLLAWQPALFLRAGLWLSGYDEVTFDQFRIGLNELELTGVGIRRGSDEGPSDHLVGRLRLEYRPGDLLRGHIEELTVEGVKLRGRIDQDGFRLESLNGEIGGGADEPAELPAIPIPDRVSIRDARLELTTPRKVWPAAL